MVVCDDAGDRHAATASKQRSERVDHVGVERVPGAFENRGPRILDGEPRAVRSIARERIEHVGDSDDATLERDLVALEAPRVAAPVPALVMCPGDRRRQLEQVAAGAAEQIVADVRVLVHQPALLVGQHSRLAQDLVRDRDLADVVQRRGQPQQLDPRLGDAERCGDVGGERAHAFEMGAGGAVVILDRTTEPAQRSRIGALERRLRRVAPLGLELPAMQRVRDVDDQVVGGERLRDVAVRTELQRRIDDADVVVPGDHHRRNVGTGPPELLEQLEAGAAGEPDVAEHDGEVFACEQLPRAVDGADADTVVAGRDHDTLDQRAHLRIVVDAQQRAHLLMRSPARALSSSAARTARASSSGANGFFSSGPFTSCVRGA